ncbi:MAG: nitrogen regulation protein NR(II) [Kofleriaceae bacterium]
MTVRPVLGVVVMLAAALTMLILIGHRVLERDREALFARFGEARSLTIEEAAHGLAAEVDELAQDLELASSLLGSAESTQIAERELHAIATIKRAYLAMYARIRTDELTTVVAFDAPTGADAIMRPTLERLLQEADRVPGVLHASGPIVAATEQAAWYRVFARKPVDGGPVISVAVDTSVWIERMKLLRDATSRFVIVDGAGHSPRASDNALAILNSERPTLFATSIEQARAGKLNTKLVAAEDARRMGLPAATAVAIAMPLAIDTGPPWTLLVVTSASALQTQEQVLVRRVLVGGALVLTLLLSAAAYVIRNRYRARALRERLRHADRLAALTEKAEKILDHIPIGVLALSDNQRVTGVNRWLETRIARDIVGVPLEEAFRSAPPEEVEQLATLVTRAMEAQEVQSLQHEQLALLGGPASLNIRAVPLARGLRDVAVLVVIDDLTEMRRMEQGLLHSEKLVTAGQLAAGIAHEIGTPLNVARGRVELALSHLGVDHQEADNHRVVLDQIDRVTRLIQQLLDYVRPAPTTLQDIDLGKTLHVVRDLLAAQAAKRAVELRVHAESPHLRADPDQIQQIVVNLAINAIDACDRGGRVELRSHTVDNAVVIEVADTGHGIPREIRKQVFDPFFTTKKRGQGTGLGLWVVAQLVRAHAAEIEIDSHPGQGTTARVTWPVLS